jgi:hypothetical protein
LIPQHLFVRNELSATIAAMEAARARWTDERIDDFAGRLDRFQERVDTHVDERLDRFDSRLDSLVQAIIIAMTSIVGVMIAQIIFG